MVVPHCAAYDRLAGNRARRMASKPLSTEVGHRPLALLVDRDADTRQMYAAYLKLLACEVDEAEDGREALAKALTRRPDVVVTDSRLPGINGIDLCKLLRRDIATHAIPLIVFTGDSSGSDVRRAEAAGASVILTKPCVPEKLADELQRLLVPAPGSAVPAVDGHRVATNLNGLSGIAADVKTRRTTLSRAHTRGDTTTPAIPPPALLCPTCDQPLRYERSHIGGVSARHPEQWDYYDCTAGCGTFQFRQRTRKLRKI